VLERADFNRFLRVLCVVDDTYSIHMLEWRPSKLTDHAAAIDMILYSTVLRHENSCSPRTVFSYSARGLRSFELAVISSVALQSVSCFALLRVVVILT
jgi:hypothetical protein